MTLKVANQEKEKYVIVELSGDGEKWLETELRFKEGETFKLPILTRYMRFKETSLGEEPYISSELELFARLEYATESSCLHLRSLAIKCNMIYFKNEMYIRIYRL